MHMQQIYPPWFKIMCSISKVCPSNLVPSLHFFTFIYYSYYVTITVKSTPTGNAV